MTSCWHCVLSISLPSPDPPPWETTPFSSCATASSALALLFPSQPFPLLSFTAVGLPSWLPAVNSETSFFLFVLFPLTVSLLSLSVPSYRFHYCFLVFVVVVVWFFLFVSKVELDWILTLFSCLAANLFLAFKCTFAHQGQLCVRVILWTPWGLGPQGLHLLIPHRIRQSAWCRPSGWQKHFNMR